MQHSISPSPRKIPSTQILKKKPKTHQKLSSGEKWVTSSWERLVSYACYFINRHKTDSRNLQFFLDITDTMLMGDSGDAQGIISSASDETQDGHVQGKSLTSEPLFVWPQELKKSYVSSDNKF